MIQTYQLTRLGRTHLKAIGRIIDLADQIEKTLTEGREIGPEGAYALSRLNSAVERAVRQIELFADPDDGSAA